MKKIVATGLAITLLFGGATFSSASISQSEAEEKAIQIVSNDNPVDAQWTAMARKAGEALGRFIGKQITSALIGGNSVTDTIYEYEEVKESFDIN